jgi:hypothetical protein
MGMMTALVAAGFLLMTPAPATSKHAYSGTVYVAGMGGHIAVADVLIDPSAATPISITDLDRIEIGGSKSHPTHDVRIDNKDGNTMYWSTYKKDKSANNQLHYGKIDIKSGSVTADKTVALPAESTWAGANYCGSGQSDKYYFPISMAMEGYIDVIDKSTMELKDRVLLNTFLPDKNYRFAHSINSPDGKYYFVAINKSTPKTKDEWSVTGEYDLYLLDMAALENGEAKVIKKNTIKGGNPGKTTTFRMSYTPDGKYIMQSAADMMFLIDAATLELVAKENRLGNKMGMDNHDVVNVGTDGKYAIATLRTQYTIGEETYKDGAIQLYDLTKKEPVGKPVSVCKSCHDDAGYEGHAVLCGAEAQWK